MITNLKRENVYFVSQFQRFQFTAAWPSCTGPVMVLCIMAGVHNENCSPHGSQEAMKEKEVGVGPDIPLKDTPTVTKLPLGPIS
jgi:hypothetical protein